MENIFSIIKITLLLIVVFALIYPLAIYGIAQFAPNSGKGETLSVNGKVVGHQKIGQKFNKSNRFWGRPSAVDYNAAGSSESNKRPSNQEYLAVIKKRIDTFLLVHPYLKKFQIPADIVIASGNGRDPNISPQAALIKVHHVAKERNLPAEEVQQLVESIIRKLAVMVTDTVNVLELNIALDQLK